MKRLDETIIQNRKLQNDLIDILVDKMEKVYEKYESGDQSINIKDGTYKLVYNKLRKIFYNISNEELVLLIQLVRNQ